MEHTPNASTLPSVRVRLSMAGVPTLDVSRHYGGPSSPFQTAAATLHAILNEIQARLKSRRGDAVDDMRDGLQDRASAMRAAMVPLQSLQTYCPDGHPATLEWGFGGDRSGYGATVTVSLHGGGAA